MDNRLHQIMIAIHKNRYETAEKYGTPGNLVNGANIDQERKARCGVNYNPPRIFYF